MKQASWEDLVTILRKTEFEDTHQTITGRFRISDSTDLSALRACIASENNARLVVDEAIEIDDLKIGDTVSISTKPRLGFGLIKPDIDTLLTDYQKSRINAVSFFFTSDRSSSLDPFPESHPVSRYRLVVRLIETLKRAAIFLDTEQTLLVYYKDGKFDIPIEYDSSDLESLSSDSINQLISVIRPGPHEKECAAILADAVISTTKHVSTRQRFRHLLKHADEIKKNVDHGYTLFASGFSYERLKSQVESAKIEYTGKIHKALSDIQNQLLALPVATIVVATQMKESTSNDNTLIINSAVLFGCWVFSILIIFILNNQSHTLRIISSEIERQRKQLEAEFSDAKDFFSDTFRDLKKRANHQRILIYTIVAIVCLGLLISHIAYFMLTPRAWEFLNHLMRLLNFFDPYLLIENPVLTSTAG
jgi:hypothetical protein